MPTGYTAKLVEEGLSFEEFTLLCARAFGACIMQRDDPMDEKPKLNIDSDVEYHKNKIEEYQKELGKFLAMSSAESNQFADGKRNEDIKYYKERIQIEKEQNDRINEMLEKVRNWNPPSAEHDGLKSFMIQQLEISFNKSEYYVKALKDAETTSNSEYYQNSINALMNNIAYHKKEAIKAVDRMQGRNKWIRELYHSLGMEIE